MKTNWNESDSDPISYIKVGMEAIKKQTGYRPPDILSEHQFCLLKKLIKSKADKLNITTSEVLRRAIFRDKGDE